MASQGEYQTVAQALQTAVKSVLGDEDMRYKTSFYYWAAFISHGFASVLLDDELLARIHHRLEALRSGSDGGQGRADGEDGGETLAMAIMTLTRQTYFRLKNREETLSREWREQWNAESD